MGVSQDIVQGEGGEQGDPLMPNALRSGGNTAHSIEAESFEARGCLCARGVQPRLGSRRCTRFSHKSWRRPYPFGRYQLWPNQVWPSCFTKFGQTICSQHQLLAKPSLANTIF